MSDLEHRLEDLFAADSRARGVDRVVLHATAARPMRAFLFVATVALAAVAAIAAFETLRPATDDVAKPTDRVVASPSSAQSPSATPPTGVVTAVDRPWTDGRYGIWLAIPNEYRVSTIWSKEDPRSSPATTVMFTALDPAQEATLSKDCGEICPAKNYTALLMVFTDAGSLTPRDWYAADRSHGSHAPGTTVSDTTIAGHAALAIVPGAGPEKIQFAIADGNGRMYLVEYLVYDAPGLTVPAGASLKALADIVYSFGFTNTVDVDLGTAGDAVAIAGHTYRIAPSSLSGTTLWRDFMPVSEPDGRPLIAAIRVESTDGSPIPPSITADHFWVFGPGPWEGTPSEVRRSPDGGTPASAIDVIARMGPKWPTGLKVDVVVRLRAAGAEYLLRLRGVPIEETH